VDVMADVLAMLPTSVASIQFIDDMVSLLQGSDERLALAVDVSLYSSLGFTIVKNSELSRTHEGNEDG
jgi:hypothetical protein